MYWQRSGRAANWMRETFPDFEKHNRVDLYYSQVEHKVVNGRYLSAALKYEKDPFHKYHTSLYNALVESLLPPEEEPATAQVLVCWGKAVRDWKEEVYGVNEIETENPAAKVC